MSNREHSKQFWRRKLFLTDFAERMYLCSIYLADCQYGDRILRLDLELNHKILYISLCDNLVEKISACISCIRSSISTQLLSLRIRVVSSANNLKVTVVLPPWTPGSPTTQPPPLLYGSSCLDKTLSVGNSCCQN